MSSNHFGIVTYTDNIELRYPTYLREMFRYAQRVNEFQASNVEFTHTID